MQKERIKKILKIIAILYVASFLIINWNDVSWVFNYRAVSGLVSDFFNPYPSINAADIGEYFYPNHSTTQGTENDPGKIIENVKTNYTDKKRVLEIPKINISVPIIFSKDTDNKSLVKDLDSGVVYYPGSVFPGQIGQIVILGHSAPPGWPKIKHDWVFTNLDDLSEGDSIFIDLDNKQYTYIVRQKSIIAKGADTPASSLSVEKNVLTLISCWPPGKNYQRIAVEAVLLEN